MGGGMRLDNDDIREMPLRIQEQLGTALVAQMAKAAQAAIRIGEQFDQANPVAGREEKRPMKVPVRILRFPSPAAAARYKALRDAAREGVIYDLDTVQYDGCTVAFTYKIARAGEILPTGVSLADWEHWRWLGRGAAVTEHIKKRGLP